MGHDWSKMCTETWCYLNLCPPYGGSEGEREAEVFRSETAGTPSQTNQSGHLPGPLKGCQMDGSWGATNQPLRV